MNCIAKITALSILASALLAPNLAIAEYDHDRHSHSTGTPTFDYTSRENATPYEDNAAIATIFGFGLLVALGIAAATDDDFGKRKHHHYHYGHSHYYW